MEHPTGLPDKTALLKEVYGTDNQREAFGTWLQDNEDRIHRFVRDIPLDMCSGMKLPYYAPTDSIPQPLPTVEDIVRARHNGGIIDPVRHRASTHEVYRVNDVFAVKFSRSTHVIQEAENLLFLEQQQTKLRIPKLYAAFSHHGEDPRGRFISAPSVYTCYYIVMEYIPGICLNRKTWGETSREFRTGIIKKVSEQLNLLRSIPAPEPGYYGRVNNQPWTNWFPAFRTRKGEPRGPFHTKEEFIEALSENATRKALANSDPEDWSPPHSIGLRNVRHVLSKFEGWEPKMTHLDLKMDNMILRPINPPTKSPINPPIEPPEVRKWWQWWQWWDTQTPLPERSELSELKAEDYEVVIIDWEVACWMPAWVEIVNMRDRSPDNVPPKRLWMSEISKGLDQFYFAELALFRYLEQQIPLDIF